MREVLKSAWLIAAAVLIPLLLFVVFQTGFAAREERRAIEARSLAEAEAIIVAADAVVARSIGAIEALSTIQALPQGDVASAYRRAREVAALNRDWVSVVLTQVGDGTILFDLRRPFGLGELGIKPKPAPRGTVVGPVVTSGAGCPCVAIERAAPGRGGGYVVTVLLSLEPLFALLPTDRARYEVSAIATRDGRFVVRSLDQQHRVGQPASKYLRAAVASGKPTGIYRGFTLEGFENYSAFARSRLTGWSAHVAMGAEYIDTPARRFMGSLGLAALLSLVLAGALTWFALHQLAQGRIAADRRQQAQKLEALGQLTGGIAHDFNNLLTPIVGALDFLLKKSSLDDRGRRIANGALASAQRAGKLTAQLLAFSRRQKLAIEPLDVPAMFDELSPILTQAVGADHVVEVGVADGPMCVRSDHNQLELAVLNLVINARDSSPRGSTIRVETDSERRGEEEFVVIRVSDSGEGMSDEVRRRALEPFFTTKSHGRGSGLGLAQVFGVMEQSGGSVDIQSKVGEGTTVTMRLPACTEPAAARIRHASSIPAREVAPLRLLLVDDDAAVRGTLARQLEEYGHTIDSVGDGRIALTAIEHCHYDLVIIDFAMPAMDGAKVIARAREVKPDQKFLMITGYADSEAVAAACPATPIVRKPFDLDSLVATITELAA